MERRPAEGPGPEPSPDRSTPPAEPAAPPGAEAPRGEDRQGLGWFGMILWLLVLLPLLVFLPLLLSGLEHATLGTDHVEQLCRRLGIHGGLTRIYRPVVSAAQSVLRAIF